MKGLRQYQHLPGHLQQQLAALPALQPMQRPRGGRGGRGRGGGGNHDQQPDTGPRLDLADLLSRGRSHRVQRGRGRGRPRRQPSPTPFTNNAPPSTPADRSPPRGRPSSPSLSQRHASHSPQHYSISPPPHHSRSPSPPPPQSRSQSPSLDDAPNRRLNLLNINSLPEGLRPLKEGRGFYLPISLGSMTVECPHCHALHWMVERLSSSSNRSPTFGTCCLEGKIQLPYLTVPPPPLDRLFKSRDDVSKAFRKNLRRYNAAFAMVSLGVQVDHAINNGGGPPIYRIKGELKHQLGHLLPNDDGTARYAQLYFLSTAEAARDQRLANNHGPGGAPVLDGGVCLELHDMLTDKNVHIAKYVTAYEKMQEAVARGQPVTDVVCRLTLEVNQDKRRWNLPTTDEIAVIVEDSVHIDARRDIMLQLRTNGRLQRIYDHNPFYQPLHYVLLFPRGEIGWQWGIPLKGADLPPNDNDNSEEPDDDNGSGRRRKQRTVTQLNYYAFRLHYRNPLIESDHLFRAQSLFQQYICDGWAQTDQERLRWLRNNQDKLRVELYKGLVDASSTDNATNAGQLGSRFILPSSYIGGSRHMFQLYQDSLALARFFGPPDLFLTFTANPNWPEIQEALLPGQTASDRPDLVARVFREKARIVMKKIKQGLFGKYVAHVFSNEFQKRGFPHKHALLFLDSLSKISDADLINLLISAEIPDKEKFPELYEYVTSFMIHGPCGAHNPNAPCMVDGKCVKRYPKTFQDVTIMGQDGYPVYRRRNNGVTITKKVNGVDVVIDNTWVVPYPPLLLLLLQCHVNMEVCVSIKSFKYIHKYVYKGHDRTSMGFGETEDEIKQYLDARYVSAPEACWRIFRYDMHQEQPNVVRLGIHLEHEHSVVFNEEEDLNDIVDRGAAAKTTLTAFFDTNRKEYETEGENGATVARSCLYQEFPQKFTWHKTKKVWNIRKKGFAIGRMYAVPPNAQERFYLRLLLTVVRGPTCFEDLRRFENILHPTFKAACLARGLLTDDHEWLQCLNEAKIMSTGFQLRQLFAIILRDCHPLDPLALWNRFREHICDDLKHALQERYHIANVTSEDIYDYGLFLLDKNLPGRDVASFGLSAPNYVRWRGMEGNALLQEQRSYNPVDQRRQADERIPLLNEAQRHAFDTILSSVLTPDNPDDPSSKVSFNSFPNKIFLTFYKIFFLHGPAGTGKTFTYNTLCFALRAEGCIVLCVASSGIASLLLIGGRTSHSTFSIPIELWSGKLCNVKKRSQLADLIKEVNLIIWDEVPMQDKFCQEAVDLTFQDIREDVRPFGGVTVVFGGDFQQILPVVVKGTKQQIISQCIQKSRLWSQIKEHFYLTQNMRLNDNDREFADWLLDVGHGRNSDASGMVDLPESMRCGETSQDLINAIYGNLGTLQLSENNDQFFAERTILSPRNDEVADVNHLIEDIFPGEEKVFPSYDHIQTEEGVDANTVYPVEFLNTINASGLPPSQLRLKKGVPLMILRNLDQKNGLCNGTRAILIHIGSRVLRVRILSGDHAGKEAFIPRITLSAANELPFDLRRHQFPVRLCFAMTINKSQGQSVKYVGINLQTPVFTHGQLYVALSRCTSKERVKVVVKEGSTEFKTPNIVFKEVLLD